MKDLGKTKLCLDLQIKYFPNGMLVHQLTYIEKVLKCFPMNKSHSLSSSMVVHSLEVKNNSFRPKEDKKELLGPKIPHLNVFGALAYIANYTLLDIAFSVNLLTRYSFAPTNEVKHVLRYLRETTDMGLFYLKWSKSQLFGYTDVSYLLDPHKAQTQMRYVLTYGGTTISWRSVKQIMETCRLPFIKGNATKLYGDNVVCIAQIKGGFIKGDITKYIFPKFFHTQASRKR